MEERGWEPQSLLLSASRLPRFTVGQALLPGPEEHPGRLGPGFGVCRGERMCSLWLLAVDSWTREKGAGAVLWTGGLALRDLTSEVSPPKKRTLLVARAWGLDETLGCRQAVPGQGVAHQAGENPPCVQGGARLPGLSTQKTVDDCWEAWPGPGFRVCVCVCVSWTVRCVSWPVRLVSS